MQWIGQLIIYEIDSGKSHTIDYTHSIGPTTQHILFKNIDQDIHCNY